LSTTQQDPVIRSHPISEDRRSALENRVKASPYYNKPDPPDRIHKFKMVQAKLNGFMDDPEVTFRRYPESDQSDYARYARSIAFHRSGDNDKSLAELAPLLTKEPKNPYLWEFRGQAQFESGQVVESVPDYRTAHTLLPDDPQLQLELAQALLAVDPSDLGNKALTRTDQPQSALRPTENQLTNEALGLLQSSVKLDPENPFAYYQLAIAYGRLDKIGLAELATAEYYDAIGSMRDARGHAAQAQRLLKQGSPEWLRAQDIITEQAGPQGG
jgi:predicted Zn-dependent protease